MKFQDQNGKEIPAERIAIEECVVRGTEIRLADGSRLRATLNVQEVFRAKGATDDEGRPLYAMTSSNNLVVVEGPQKTLKRVK